MSFIIYPGILNFFFFAQWNWIRKLSLNGFCDRIIKKDTVLQMPFFYSFQVNYYIFNYFIPSGLFVIVSWVSFVIPPDSVPGRIALIITTLLVLVNIANTIFSISPAADAINAIQVRLWTVFEMSVIKNQYTMLE